MKLYQINKVAKPDGTPLKTKHKLAGNDREAIRAAREDEDCPTCDVLHEGRKVGSIT